MKKRTLSISLPFFLFLFLPHSVSAAATSSCPVDFSYVTTFPWDTSLCQAGTDNCCQTLLSLFGMGLAQHLRDTSMFQLPNVSTSSDCLSDFRSEITKLPLQASLVPMCFANSTQFVVNSSSCDGIMTVNDWRERVGVVSPLDTSCAGDLTGTQCSPCVEAGLQVNSQLLKLDPNSTECFYFAVLYAAGIANEFGPKDPRTVKCILGLPVTNTTTEDSSSDSRKILLKWVAVAVGASFGVFLAAAIIVLYRDRERRRRRNAPHEEFVTSFRSTVLPNTGAKWFSISELERATNGFSQRNMIGQGAYGIVYKGTLPGGADVAVKQVLDMDSTGDVEFRNEVEIISKIRHRNLLPLRGCCVTSDDFSGKRRYLVYDYMSNGNLGDKLLRRTKPLTWPQRKSIILDVAKGVEYLHHGIKPPIYHRDIKTTNILLDSEMKARVADFGLAKQNPDDQSHLTTRVAGTHGYLAPEYALYGQLTDKSDVYSFGIVVLEVMCGRKVVDTTSSLSLMLITDWAWMKVKSGDVDGVLEESIREEGAKAVMERFVRVGILCAHVMVALRPSIGEALKMLEGDIDIPRLPDRPVPLAHESFMASSRWSVSRTGK